MRALVSIDPLFAPINEISMIKVTIAAPLFPRKTVVASDTTRLDSFIPLNPSVNSKT